MPSRLDFLSVADPKCRTGESPVYDERTGRLYFVDIQGCRIYALETASGTLTHWEFETDVCSLGLTASGALVVALREAVIRFDPASGARRELCRIEAGAPRTRLNDGRVGPDGAFWVGSMVLDRADTEPAAALYRVDAAGNVERKVAGVRVSNGLAWTADGEIMFHADSRAPWIDRWSFDRATGALSDRRRIAAPDEAAGRPDGGSCDAAGTYWSAGISAGRLNRFASDGALLEWHALPVAAPTMPCFGGPDFRTLYVTSLREGKPEAVLAGSPLSGGVIAAAMPVSGFPSWRFLDI
jgi:sugar lactone lactonase YvrE